MGHKPHPGNYIDVALIKYSKISKLFRLEGGLIVFLESEKDIERQYLKDAFIVRGMSLNQCVQEIERAHNALRSLSWFDILKRDVIDNPVLDEKDVGLVTIYKTWDKISTERKNNNQDERRIL